MNQLLSAKERAVLRADANRLKTTVHVGHLGLSPALLKSLNEALRTRELVKVQLGPGADLPAKVAATRLADATSAQVVQVIGRKATFYRHNPDLERKAGAAPPWRD